MGEVASGAAYVAAVALGAMDGGGAIHGVITVIREGRPFTAEDLELLRSPAARATLALALANVERHDDVARQAMTDDLTGLPATATSRPARRRDPRGRALRASGGDRDVDLDNFKS